MKVVSLSALCTGRLYPREICLVLMLEAESTQGPQCARKDYVNEKYYATAFNKIQNSARTLRQCLRTSEP
jgi:hypothetical protein